MYMYIVNADSVTLLIYPGRIVLNWFDYSLSNYSKGRPGTDQAIVTDLGQTW